jgi:hypothetical protein
MIDTLIAIIGMDRIVAIISLSAVSKLSVLFGAGPDFQWNPNFSLEFNTSGLIERMPVSIFAMLNFLSYSMQGLIFDALLGIYED